MQVSGKYINFPKNYEYIIIEYFNINFNRGNLINYEGAIGFGKEIAVLANLTSLNVNLM